MFSHIFMYFFLIHLGWAQIDGEFWWLNDKFASYTGTRPPQPLFENLSEFDTDENAKIIFRDLSQDAVERVTKRQFYKDYTYNHNTIKWPDENKDSKVFTNYKKINSMREQYLSKAEHVTKIPDTFVIKFPEKQTNALVWRDSINATSTNTPFVTPNNGSSEKITPNTLYKDKDKHTHKEHLSTNVCNNIKKSNCKPSNGIQVNNIEYETKQSINLTCCNSTLKNKGDHILSKIYFPDMLENVKKRFKRSNNIAQKQRNVLLKRRYGHQTQRPELEIKISTPDYEDDDPYWNIRNVKNPNKQNPESSTVYNNEDYIEDYVIELPRPGLTGVYSDNNNRPSTWNMLNPNKGPSYGGDDVDDYDDDVSSTGYSTIDPRIESDTTRISKLRPIPMKRTPPASEEITYDAESQTISYNSNPDFNILQGFKLLNLLTDRNKVSKVPIATTTDSFFDNDSQESIVSSAFANSKVTNDNKNRQVYKNCKQAVIPLILKSAGKQIGNAPNGSHPWLALLVPTGNLNKFLCYATLIHPRAAITAANCVHRRTQKEISLITGLWNLNERSGFKSRVVSWLIHPDYKIGELSNNLAILHWKRPLKLGVNMQPICLSNVDLDYDCLFVGWGGFDQAMQPRSKWQRASIHTCKDRLSLNGINIPKRAFCASVETRTTVTGVGGSLVCNINGHLSAVGVAVSRDSTVVLLPIYDWVMEVIDILEE